ncbi:MAG: ATP-dependent nuclease [Candidatus Saccharimonadales bacterium]
MFIKELLVSNFKGFSGAQPTLTFNVPDGTLGSGLNVFVGENNTGKSTLLEAVDFLRNGTRKSVDLIKNKNTAGEAIIELVFEGGIVEVIDAFSQENKKNVFKKYVFGDDGNLLKLRRDTENLQAIRLWESASNEFKNESGIDAPTKKLFETNFVWADTNPNDEVAFGASTICGHLLKEISTGIVETDEYRAFTDSFHRTFNSDESALKKALRDIENETKQIFQDQFGNGEIGFRFDELKPDSFFKNVGIDVDDGVKTSIAEKGSGMQRAVALAMLQVYANRLVKHPDGGEVTKPFFLFIDEPEVCLHPKAQEKLLGALLEISKIKQVFLTTHSPFFLATKALSKIGLYIFKRTEDGFSIEPVSEQNKLLPWSPTWGEINFRAYQLPTVEFHNELYGRLQEISGAWKTKAFDEWLNQQGVDKSRQWTRENNGVAGQAANVTLQTFIRNKIHHPENTTMQAAEYSTDELSDSIEKMMALITTNAHVVTTED